MGAKEIAAKTTAAKTPSIPRSMIQRTEEVRHAAAVMAIERAGTYSRNTSKVGSGCALVEFEGLPLPGSPADIGTIMNQIAASIREEISTAVRDDLTEQLKEACVAVHRRPRADLVILSAFPELFSVNCESILQMADGVLIDLDEFSAHEEALDSWIDRAYDLHKHVFAVGSPESLSNAACIERRSLTAIPRSGSLVKLRHQRLADAVAKSIEELFRGVPGRGNPFSVEPIRSAWSAKSARQASSSGDHRSEMMGADQQNAVRDLLDDMDL